MENNFNSLKIFDSRGRNQLWRAEGDEGRTSHLAPFLPDTRFIKRYFLQYPDRSPVLVSIYVVVQHILKLCGAAD
jgi:hypothetical protein